MSTKSGMDAGDQSDSYIFLQVLEAVLDLLALHHNCLPPIIVLHALGLSPMVQPQDQVALHPMMLPQQDPLCAKDQASHFANLAIPNWCPNWCPKCPTGLQRQASNARQILSALVGKDMIFQLRPSPT